MSRIAFLFPGQGAQKVGMGKELAENFPAAAQLFDQANDILGYDLKTLCFEGPQKELDSTVYSQPALFVTSLAALEKLRAESPDIVMSCEAAAGLSLGEYTAMVFAGMMTFADGLRLVQKRGQAMQDASDATPSGMVSILGLERSQVQAVCQEVVDQGETIQIANLLCPGNIVVSGTVSGCELAAELAEKAGAMKTIPLPVAGAFHTPIMRPADEHLAAALKDIPMQEGKIPVISNVDAAPHTSPEDGKELLERQILSPVRWEDSMQYLLAEGFDTFYEVGPGRVLRGLLRRINRKISCQCVID
ncbi:Malonyl CoA-acyl carrier protein transacylase [Planctomycetales bacterium 10988]|nr:Malonyl CoA-acyl carrier protein transacylase [Planctomycetales bacterium 10988]